MFPLLVSFVVVGGGLAWRLSGATLCLQVLLCGAALLTVAARSWFHPASRSAPPAVDAPYVDLQRRRLEDVDAYVRERLAAGDDVAQIASSARWFESEGGSRGRAG